MDIVDYLVLFVLAYWLIATIVSHFSPELFPKRLFDILSFKIFPIAIPAWTFFAPNPGTMDYFILFREIDTSGEMSNWNEVFKERRPSKLQFVWNPYRDLEKAILDISIDLAREIIKYKDELRLVSVTIPYITIVNMVSNQIQYNNTIAVQFTLFQKDGNNVNEIFTSGVHKIQAA